MKKIKVSVLISLVVLFSACNSRPIHVFMAGDSTMAEKPLSKPVTDSVIGEVFDEVFLERGWGMFLPVYLKKNTELINLAQNGRSTRSFKEQGRWYQITEQLQAGDVVVIQFGHNDGSVNKADRYTPPEDYRSNLVQMVKDVRAKKAYPILCTSIAKRKFDQEGKIVSTHGVYPDIAKEVADSMHVPLVDLFQQTIDWLEAAGVEKSVQYFHKIPADGKSKLFPKGLDDNTHLNEQGAVIVAGFFAKAVKKQKIKPLSKYIR